MYLVDFSGEFTDILTELFTELKFDVEVHIDLTLKDLEELLLYASDLDHSNFDAFICCILTHGNLGVVYASDAKPIRILDIVEFFYDDHCKSLSDKPKMFFFEACMTGNYEFCWNILLRIYILCGKCIFLKGAAITRCYRNDHASILTHATHHADQSPRKFA